MRGYQTGGLAAVTEEEEVMGPEGPALDVSEIVERTTNPKAGQSLASMILQNKQQAIDRLAQGRTQIAERRAAQKKSDDRAKWLSLAQGMLAPTRTGSFGESLGNTAGLLRQETELRSKHEADYDAQLDALTSQEIAAESESIDQLLKMSGYANSNRAKSLHGSIQTMVAPEDVDKPIAQQRIVFGAVMEGPDGQPVMQALKDPNGQYFQDADRLEPARAAALIEATERAESQTGRSEGMIAEAYGMKTPLMNVRRANELFKAVDPTKITTGGIQELKNQLANFLTIDLGDTTELTELQMLVADDYLTKLADLKGSSSDRDVMEMKGISLGLGRDTEANYRQLIRMENIYEASIRRGVREAYQSNDMDAVEDLWESAANFKWVPGAKPIGSKAEYDALKKGQAFFAKGDWGGEIRIKTED